MNTAEQKATSEFCARWRDNIVSQLVRENGRLEAEVARLRERVEELLVARKAARATKRRSA